MKRSLFFVISLCLAFDVFSQSYSVSRVGSLSIEKEIKPAILNIDPNSVKFVDATGNNAIDAQESCKLVFDVSNSGVGQGVGCIAKIKGTGATSGVSFRNVNLGVIGIGATQRVEIPITSSMTTTDGRIEFAFEVTEPNGFGTDPFTIDVATRAFVAPKLQVTDYTITGTSSTVLEKKRPFDLQVLLQNTQYGLAEDISVTIKVPENVYLLGGEELVNFDKMTAGQTKSLDYSLIANNNYTGSSIPVQLIIREKHGKYAENRTIDLAFNQTFASAKIAVDEIREERGEIQIATLGSDVDRDIPQNPTNNSNTFAFIIANEHYQSQNFAQVPFAVNDGRSFSDYCGKTLGLPKENIYFSADVTYARMLSLITQIKTTSAVNPGCNIIFYYAGHGAPSEGTQEAFLIPVDAYQVSGQVCFSLQKLYDEFHAMSDSRVTVFLDACFSGVNRDNTMLASARGVAIKPKENKVEGNIVVFSAASGDETAWPYNSENHGLFTYFLLKKLQETKGEATYADLYDYIYREVRRVSNNVNHKLQNPTVNSSLSLGSSWENWKLK